MVNNTDLGHVGKRPTHHGLLASSINSPECIAPANFWIAYMRKNESCDVHLKSHTQLYPAALGIYTQAASRGSTNTTMACFLKSRVYRSTTGS